MGPWEPMHRIQPPLQREAIPMHRKFFGLHNRASDIKTPCRNLRVSQKRHENSDRLRKNLRVNQRRDENSENHPSQSILTCGDPTLTPLGSRQACRRAKTENTLERGITVVFRPLNA